MTKKIRQSIVARLFFLLVLVVLAVYVSLYTLVAYDVARYVIKLDGALQWAGRWGSDPRFFPFPDRPVGPILWVITGMHPTDRWIYTNLIENRMLIVLSFLLWLLVAIYFYKAVWRFIFRLV